MIFVSCQKTSTYSVTIPVTFDHNRMLVEAEIKRLDGTWRKARLWIDTGNPDCFISESLANDLGIDLAAKVTNEDGQIPPLDMEPPSVRIGGMDIDFSGVNSHVIFQPEWLFNTMHNDANLPSTVLKKYHVIFNYPQQKLTIAKPGVLRSQGLRAPASIHPETGIVQIDAVIDGDSLSFALDNGASYSFVSAELLSQLKEKHPTWPRHEGAVGCANIWGWWPEEEKWPVMRIPAIEWGSTPLKKVGLVGVPNFLPGGMDLGAWYSQKAARPVDGILGPNAYKDFRVEIDYANGAVYFEKGNDSDLHDMDLVGLTLRPEANGSYQVIGVAQIDGRPTVQHIKPGDILLQIDDFEVTGATMGTVVDALRGKPGDVRILIIQRDGEELKIEAEVKRFL